MKKILLLLFLFSLLFENDRLSAQSEIIEKLDAYRVPYEAFMLSLTLTSFKGGKVDEAARFDVYLDGDDKSLVIAKEYSTRDMKILYVDENMWVHIPNTHRPIRITPVQRLMGEAANGDVARVSYGQDYTVETVGDTVIAGVSCFILKLLAQKKSATYHKIILYAQKNNYMPVQAQYFLISGKHFKSAYFECYEKIHGKPVLTKLTIYDQIRKNRKTTFEYFNIKKKKMPAKYFNKNYLVHLKGF